ncbi:hypothetical protein CK203_031053 [Vitis vinifera]|uniref:Uncharacterized protein n=1 Tax=Vitis vinifera TaxID=29760 RepID=A0A438I1B3_VITVI|nr:hypothetical protein CK203_031053 [Vitis vinifera]
MRGSACVEVMTTLHGSAPSLRRRAEGCVPPEDYLFFYTFLEPYPYSVLRALWDRTFVPCLDIPLVEGRLVRVSDTPDMDQQVVTVDQFTAAMASIQEALASLRQEIGGQQVRPPTVQDETPYDSHPPPPPPPFLQCIRHHHMYYTGILRSLYP